MMNKEQIIELIKKSKGNEIVLICGSYFVCFNQNDDEIEVNFPKEDKQNVWNLVHDDSIFESIDNNMQTIIRLKK